MECTKKLWTTNSNNTSEVLNSYRDLSMVIICKKTWPISSGWRATMLIAQLKIKILLKSPKWRKICSKIYQMKSCSTYIISGHIISGMWPTFHYIFIDFVELHMWHDFTRPELTLTSNVQLMQDTITTSDKTTTCFVLFSSLEKNHTGKQWDFFVGIWLIFQCPEYPRYLGVWDSLWHVSIRYLLYYASE